MEKRDLYDSNRNLTGETILKGDKIPEGKYLVVVLIFIQNSSGKFLIQKYSSGKSEKESVFWDAYYIKLDVEDIKKLKLQKEEVSYIEWLSEEEIVNLMKQNKFLKNHYEEFEISIKWLNNK